MRKALQLRDRALALFRRRKGDVTGTRLDLLARRMLRPDFTTVSSLLWDAIMRLGDRAPRSAWWNRKSSVTYPFSSTRQHKRYARQIAAGQLQMLGVPQA